MSRYYVVLPDGQRYGPANVQLLNTWIAEGRVLPETVVEDVTSGQRTLVGQVPGVSFVPAQAYAPPSPYHAAPHHQPYLDPLPDAYQDRWQGATGGFTVASFAATVVSPCVCTTPVGWILAGVGLILGIAGRSRGERGSGCAIAAALLMLGLTFFMAQFARFVTAG